MYATARRLAGLQRDDIGVQFNKSAAIDLFQRCIDEQNHVGAMFDLAGILEKEHQPDDSNFLRSIALYERCAVESNNCQAKLSLARLLWQRRQRRPTDTVDAVRAVQLYGECIQQTADGKAMYELARILEAGAPGVEKDVSRALQLYEKCIHHGEHGLQAMDNVIWNLTSGTYSAENIILHALQIFNIYLVEHADADDGLQFVHRQIYERRRTGSSLINAPYVVRLLEICIEERNDTQAMVLLADILLFGAAHVERDVCRGLQLCATALEAEDDLPFCTIADIARNLVDEQWRTPENASIAAQLCEMCIEKKSDAGTVLTLAETLMAADLRVEETKDRAGQLCANPVDGNRSFREQTNLAREIVYRPFHTAKDAKLAMQLCEMLTANDKDADTMLILAELLMREDSGVVNDVPRGLTLCAQYLEITGSCYGVTNLAIKLARVTHGKNRYILLAMQLCEMCVDMMNDAEAMVVLAELLITETTDVGNNIERAMLLCEKYLDATGSCAELTNLARKLTNEISTRAGDARLAVQLCEMCINKRTDTHAMMVLAEMLMRGAPDVEEDVDRAMKLYKDCFDAGVSWYRVKRRIREVAFGAKRTAKNVALAMNLFELYLVTTNDVYAIVSFLEIIVSASTDSDEIKCGMELCMTYLKGNRISSEICSAIVSLARRIMNGRSGIARNVQLALQLCEMCLATWNELEINADVLLDAAEVIICAAASSADVEDAMHMCEVAIRSGGSCRKVATIARDVAFGRKGMVQNTKLAIRLCELSCA